MNKYLGPKVDEYDAIIRHQMCALLPKNYVNQPLPDVNIIDKKKKMEKIPPSENAFAKIKTGGLVELIDFPPEILQLILKNLTFEEIAKLRIVCHHFNNVCSTMLNSEFSHLRFLMQQRFHNLKSQMPRRESARRKHPLVRECDIVETLHMRLSLLHMTFGKHIERKHCCFFPGEILDEVYKIIQYISNTPSLNRAYKVTDELFDLSTMAMEYFKDQIEPSLPEISFLPTDYWVDYATGRLTSSRRPVSAIDNDVACSSTSNARTTNADPPTFCPVVTKHIKKMRDDIKTNDAQITIVKRSLQLKQKKISTQQKEIQHLKLQFKDLEKKNISFSSKLNNVIQELNQCKSELKYWHSTYNATVSHEELRHESLTNNLEDACLDKQIDNLSDERPLNIQENHESTASKSLISLNISNSYLNKNMRKKLYKRHRKYPIKSNDLKNVMSCAKIGNYVDVDNKSQNYFHEGNDTGEDSAKYLPKLQNKRVYTIRKSSKSKKAKLSSL